ncbi:asparagine synthetase B [Arenicella chitinivorans]|uniref:asparagine synthase (glutamine-hydrolyzing) n=1 Tax=Arenicella chitinivorans TaxID=1329800 RepID=A0A918VMD1_9GAMM|nr:asparagine synthase-related protein [Arenicella chitinivorans]GHA07587.1 asparagine synthetase B [Arenicella chitinivorans]
MSAFFFALNRQGQLVDPSRAERMMTALEAYGPDASRLICDTHFAMGYQSRWDVPEEVGERQPLFDHTSQQYFAFHGRIDNRERLLKELPDVGAENTSDAQLLFAYLQAFGEHGINEVIGPFVFVWFDQQQQRVLAARDAMGGRCLFYYLDDELFLISTSEACLIAYGVVPFEFNEAKVGRLLVGEMDVKPTSVIASVSVLRPGQCALVAPGMHSLKRFYQAPDLKFNGWTDVDYAGEFRRLLTQATRRRMRSVGRVGTMLSGGLDSVPMTVCAAEESVEGVDAYSWVFDVYPEADERHYSQAVCRNFNLTQHEIVCDHQWPGFDDTMFLNPTLPVGTPYSEFQQETFRRARAQGVRVLLTGIHGDLLYESTHGLLYDLSKQGRWRDAWSEFRRLWRAVPESWLVVKYYLLLPIPWVARVSSWRKRQRYNAHPSLQPDIAKQCAAQQSQSHWLADESRGRARPEQWQVVMDHFAGEDMAYGRVMEAKFDIERRYPYRDRELCEFMLSVPSDQLYFQGVKRPIVKRAFHDTLPDPILGRNNKTSFNTVIDAGIQRDFERYDWFDDSPRQWQGIVRPAFFDDLTPENSKNNLLRWRCAYYDYWKSVCYNRMLCELGQIDNNNESL